MSSTKTTKTNTAAADPANVVPEEITSETAKSLDDERSAEELLVDMPDLKPIATLRLAKQNSLVSLRRRMQAIVFQLRDATASEDEAAAEADYDRVLRLTEKLDAVWADFDAFAESIAIDPAAYAEWAQGKSAATFQALAGKLLASLGE